MKWEVSIRKITRLRTLAPYSCFFILWKRKISLFNILFTWETVCFEGACVFCSDTAKYSSRQWSLNTQDLCFCGRVGECQVHSCLFDRSGRWVLGTGWRMLFVCDILEHLKEMIGQSAINRRSQSFIPQSLRGFRGKRRARRFVFAWVQSCSDGGNNFT